MRKTHSLGLTASQIKHSNVLTDSEERECDCQREEEHTQGDGLAESGNA